MRKQNQIVKRLNEISTLATDCVVLRSNDYGDVEAWNLVTCYIQNAEDMKNDLLSHIECSLASESPDVQAYFRNLGITY